jgi:hypothetical protein
MRPEKRRIKDYLQKDEFESLDKMATLAVA